MFDLIKSVRVYLDRPTLPICLLQIGFLMSTQKLQFSFSSNLSHVKFDVLPGPWVQGP